VRGLRIFIGDLWIGFVLLGAIIGAIAPVAVIVYIFYELLR